MPLTFFQQFFLLLKKDLLLSQRRSASFVSIVFFSLLVVIIFQFSIDLEGRSPIPFAGPFIWLGSLFGGMLRMSRTFEPELKGRAIDGLRLIKTVVLPLYVSKFLFNVGFMILLEGLIFFIVTILFNLPDPLLYIQIAWPAFVLGAIGFSAIGTTFSGMVLGESTKDLLLPIISYPILSPLVIGVVKSLEYSATGSLIALNSAWLELLVAFDLMYVILSLLVFDVLLESE
jgi:heme exporter protein B